MDREFTAHRPNELRLTDITEHPTSVGKLYLCAIKDVFSNRIVVYSISHRMKTKLAVDALKMAVARRGNATGCVMHSDRGSQFRAKNCLAVIRHNLRTGFTGQVGSARDNAATQSFFALHQKNVLDRQRWSTRHDLRMAIITWLERTYHRR